MSDEKRFDLVCKLSNDMYEFLREFDSFEDGMRVIKEEILLSADDYKAYAKYKGDIKDAI